MIFLAYVLIFVGIFGLCFGTTVRKHTFPEKTNCWGTCVTLDSRIKRARKSCVYAGVALAIGIIIWMAESIIAGGNFELDLVVHMILPMILALLPIPFGVILGEKWTMKTIQKSQNTLLLGEFTPLQVANDNFEKTTTIEIFYYGIVLYDNTGFAFERIIFEQNSLENFSDAKQMIMLSTYFLQKYPFVLKMKLNEVSSSGSTTGNAAVDFGSSTAALTTSISGGNIKSISLSKK